jgi:hypothetical protein
MEARHSCVPCCEVGRVEIEPARPDDDRDAGFEAQSDVRTDGVRAREVDRRIASRRAGLARVDDLVAGLAERRPEYHTDLPRRAVQRDPHQAAFSRSAGLTRSTASANRLSSGPIPATDSRSTVAGVRELRDLVRGHGFEALDHLLRREERVAVTVDLPSLVMR